jgi:class 3 adenylate cyclase
MPRRWVLAGSRLERQCSWAAAVTFLFTDVEGSTKLLHELGAEAYADVLADHRGVAPIPP